MLEKRYHRSDHAVLKDGSTLFCVERTWRDVWDGGYPRCMICCLDGRFFAFEVKTPDGVVTKLQERTIHKIKVAGGHAYVVRSVDDVKAVLWAYAGIDI